MINIRIRKFEDRKFGDQIRNLGTIFGNLGIGNLGILEKVKSKNQKFGDQK